jgi:2-hydroxychromene-2-carboxylate isomerase
VTETAPLFGQVRFYFDLSSGDAYVAAERAHEVLGVVPEWVPILMPPAFRCAEEVASHREDVERRAAGLQALRWPDPYPPDSEFAMLVATYAREIGRCVAFSLAAFRQAFAAGRDLGDRDTALIAGAACELHPTALIKGAGLRSTRERLDAATAAAIAAGVREVPAIQIGEDVFCGTNALEDARASQSLV